MFAPLDETKRKEMRSAKGRDLFSGWGPRRQSPESIAERTYVTVDELRRLGALEHDLWPRTEVRALRPSDPTLSSMTVEDFGRLIDRKARFDPPPAPMAVSPWGYKILLTSNHRGHDPQGMSLTVQAGGFRPDMQNEVVFNLHGDNPLWAAPEVCLTIVRRLAEIWDSDWSGAQGVWGDLMDWKPYRWIYWARPGADPLPYRHAPPPDGPPDEVREMMGGELSIWNAGAGEAADQAPDSESPA